MPIQPWEALHRVNVQLVKDVGYHLDDVLDPGAPLRIIFDERSGTPEAVEFHIIGSVKGAHSVEGDSFGRTVSTVHVPIGQERAERYLRDVRKIYDLPNPRALRPRPNLERLDRVRLLWEEDPILRSVVARSNTELYLLLNELLGFPISA